MAVRGNPDSGALVAVLGNSSGVMLINLAIVGLGKFGRRHVEAATASGRFRVVRAVVRNPGPTQAYAATRSIQLSCTFAEVLEDPTIHAVSLATPHSLHVPQAIQAAAAGKHVLVEKPFALTAAEAEKAVLACNKAGVVVAVGHDNRFYPTIREIKRLVDEGTLGKIIHAEANLSHDSMRGTLGSADGTRLQSGAWRLDRAEAPVGAMAHLGVHRIDTYVQLFGKVSHAYAIPGPNTLCTDWEDSVFVLLRFAAGMTAYLGTSLATPLNSRMQIFGSEGWAEAIGPRDFKDYVHASLRTVSVRVADGKSVTREFDTVDSVMLNFCAFADAIEGKASYPIPTCDMIHVPAVLEAITQSLASGKSVSIP